MDAIRLIDRLKQKTVFNIADIERIAQCNGGYAKLLLNRLAKRGIIKHIRRNDYTVQSNVFAIASNIIYPCYISFWSASYFLGYTEQMVMNVQVAVTKKSKLVKFEGNIINFIPVRYFFGYKKIKTDEGEIFIAENEKLIIDVLYKWREIGNFDEINKIIQNADISEVKIVEYLKRTKNQTIIKRAGCLLEKIKKMDISRHFKLDSNYILLNPFLKKWTKINSKWRVKE